MSAVEPGSPIVTDASAQCDARERPRTAWKHRLRWHLKKSGRGSLALASWMLDSARNAQNSVQPGSVRVLTYHRFGNTSYDPFCVSPVDFETQMAFLAQHKRALSLLRFEQFLSGSIELPNDSVLVTIDDGHLSTWSTAMPILRRHGIPAVAFVTPNMVGRQTAGNVRIAEGYAGWPELRELLRCGIEVASHSMSHKSFGSMSATEVREEAVRSKSVLEDRLGIEVTTFAYPYGTRADFNSSTAKILRDVGYRLAFTSQHGAIRRGANPWELPRIKIEGSEPIWMFRLATHGGLDRWKWIDRGLWRLQASPGGRR